MLFGNERLYEQSRQAKLGKSSLPEPLRQLGRWVSEKYSVNVLHVVYDTIDIGPHEGRPRLNLIVETDDDYKSLHKDSFTIKPSVKAAVLRQFAALVSTADCREKYETNDVHLISDNFSDESLGKAAAQFLQADKKQIIREFRTCNIWDIFGFSRAIVVFYMKDGDRRRNQLNGCDDAITQRCYDHINKYDEFGYLDRQKCAVTFDSKENLDKNYAGSLFYYFR